MIRQELGGGIPRLAIAGRNAYAAVPIHLEKRGWIVVRIYPFKCHMHSFLSAPDVGIQFYIKFSVSVSECFSTTHPLFATSPLAGRWTWLLRRRPRADSKGISPSCTTTSTTSTRRRRTATTRSLLRRAMVQRRLPMLPVSLTTPLSFFNIIFINIQSQPSCHRRALPF